VPVGLIEAVVVTVCVARGERLDERLALPVALLERVAVIVTEGDEHDDTLKVSVMLADGDPVAEALSELDTLGVDDKPALCDADADADAGADAVAVSRVLIVIDGVFVALLADEADAHCDARPLTVVEREPLTLVVNETDTQPVEVGEPECDAVERGDAVCGVALDETVNTAVTVAVVAAERDMLGVCVMLPHELGD